MRPTQFVLEFDQRKIVKFDLIDHPIATVWAALLDGYYHHPLFDVEQTNERFQETNLDMMLSELSQLSHTLDVTFPTFFDDKFLDTMWGPEISRDDLNVLHYGYERLQAWMLSRSYRRTPQERAVAQKLNELIHRIEMFENDETFKDKIGPRPRLRVRMMNLDDNTSAIVKLRYQPHDRVIFEPKKSGELYLCYAQVGKAPLSVFKDRDHEADKPVDWEWYGPAFWFSFFGHEETADLDEARAWLLDTTGIDYPHLGEPRIGTMVGDPVEVHRMLGPDPKITNMSFIYK